MRKDIMGITDVEIAAMNMNSIEHRLGKKIPVGMIDATSLGDKCLSATEVEKVVMNLKAIEHSKNRPYTKLDSLVDNIFILVSLGFIAVAVILWLFK